MGYKVTEKQLNNYKEDEFYQRWMNGLSQRTKENYGQQIKNWIYFINMTPTEQVQKRMHNLTSTNLIERTFFENKFREYKAFLEQRGDLKISAVTTMLIPVASFFSRNSLRLQLKRGDWASTQTQEVQTRFKLAKDDVRAMYLHANLRDRGLLLTLAQSGLSEVDVSCLKVENFPKLYTIAEGEHLFFEKRREKTGEMQATCLSAEALHDIKAELEERGSPKEGWLFVGQTKSKNSQLEVRTINDAMKSLAEKTFGKDKAKEFKTKALRSFYNSALLRADIKTEVKDLLMGHARLGARGHYDYDEDTIIENYKKVFEYLGVNGILIRTDVAKLKAELDTARSEFNKNIARQEADITELKESLKSATEIVYSFEPMLNTFNEIAGTPEGLELIKKLHEEKLKQEMKEAETEDNKFKAEVTKENPIPKKPKSE